MFGALRLHMHASPRTLGAMVAQRIAIIGVLLVGLASCAGPNPTEPYPIGWASLSKFEGCDGIVIRIEGEGIATGLRASPSQGGADQRRGLPLLGLRGFADDRTSGTDSSVVRVPDTGLWARCRFMAFTPLTS